MHARGFYLQGMCIYRSVFYIYRKTHAARGARLSQNTRMLKAAGLGLAAFLLLISHACTPCYALFACSIHTSCLSHLRSCMFHATRHALRARAARRTLCRAPHAHLVLRFAFLFIIVIEAFAGLSAELVCSNHLLKKRMRTILAVAELGVEYVHDCKANVKSDKVA